MTEALKQLSIAVLILVFFAKSLASELEIDIQGLLLDEETGVIRRRGETTLPPGTSRTVSVETFEFGSCVSGDEASVGEGVPGTDSLYFWSQPTRASGCGLGNSGEVFDENFQAIVIRFYGFVAEPRYLHVLDIDGYDSTEGGDVVASFGMLEGNVVRPTNVSRGEDVVEGEFLVPSSTFKKLGLPPSSETGVLGFFPGSSFNAFCYYSDEECQAVLGYEDGAVDTLVWLFGTLRKSATPSNAGVQSAMTVRILGPTPTPTALSVTPTPAPDTNDENAAGAAETPRPSGDSEETSSDDGTGGLSLENKLSIAFGSIGAIGAVAGIVFGIYEFAYRRRRRRASDSGTSSPVAATLDGLAER